MIPFQCSTDVTLLIEDTDEDDGNDEVKLLTKKADLKGWTGSRMRKKEKDCYCYQSSKAGYWPLFAPSCLLTGCAPLQVVFCACLFYQDFAAAHHCCLAPCKSLRNYGPLTEPKIYTVKFGRTAIPTLNSQISEMKRDFLDPLVQKILYDRKLSSNLSWKWPSATLSPSFGLPAHPKTKNVQ